MNSLILKIILKIRQLYWFVVRPKTQGVRAIVVDNKGMILLVKHSYNHGWYLPGGGVNRGETCEDALRRELMEEVGITCLFDEVKLGTYLNKHEYKIDTITVYIIRNYDIFEKSNIEIDQNVFFDPQSLPTGVSPGTKRRISEYLRTHEIKTEW